MTEPQKTAAIWAVVAFAFATLAVTRNTSAMVLGATFFGKFFGVILGTATGTAGAMLGDSIRLFALPDGFISDGGMGSIIRTKLFWMVGPQLIGLVIGTMIGIVLVLN